MSRGLRDVIREFARERRPEPEAALTPAPAEPAAPLPVDGATAVVMTEFLDTVHSLCELLEEESAAVAAGDVNGLEGFARRKQGLAERLEGLVVQAHADGLVLNDELRAMTLERIERLDRAVNENAAGLVALRKAVLTINRNLLNVLEKAASDGLYAPTGRSVRPVELSASGLNTEL
ncbi:MAG TPA: flagellar protein FlgN [Azospirillum sp.]|nr:flagellar protein FlgN [Azospirillum sp.]